MFQIRKLFHVEMAHRLTTSFTKRCQQLHGHSYKIEVIFSAEKVNEDGMVMDFGQVKEMAKNMINQLDHATLLHEKDGLANVLPDVVITPYNPTAEMMARDICLGFIDKLIGTNIIAVCVRLHETETGWAEFSLTIDEFKEMKEKEGEKK